MRSRYIRRDMWKGFYMLIDRGQNAHREICECSTLFFIFGQNAKLSIFWSSAFFKQYNKYFIDMASVFQSDNGTLCREEICPVFFPG